jgi:hypothetical protein
MLLIDTNQGCTSTKNSRSIRATWLAHAPQSWRTKRQRPMGPNRQAGRSKNGSKTISKISRVPNYLVSIER